MRTTTQTDAATTAAVRPEEDADQVAGEPEAAPPLRLIRVEVAGRAALATPKQQRDWCGRTAPTKVLIRLVVGSDAWPCDPAGLIAAAEIEAARPLQALRDVLLRGEPFQQAERLHARLADAEGKATEAAAAAEQALAAAREALAAGRPPDKAERDYRAKTQDAEVFRNRAAELRKMHPRPTSTPRPG